MLCCVQLSSLWSHPPPPPTSTSLQQRPANAFEKANLEAIISVCSPFACQNMFQNGGSIDVYLPVNNWSLRSVCYAIAILHSITEHSLLLLRLGPYDLCRFLLFSTWILLCFCALWFLPFFPPFRVSVRPIFIIECIGKQQPTESRNMVGPKCPGVFVFSLNMNYWYISPWLDCLFWAYTATSQPGSVSDWLGEPVSILLARSTFGYFFHDHCQSQSTHNRSTGQLVCTINAFGKY